MLAKTKNFLLTLVLLNSVAWAKPFASKFCEFELPPGWSCALEGTDYVCQSETADRKKEAIIILAAKIRGEQDSLDEYMAYLKKNKEYSLPGGKSQVSEPKFTKMTDINNHRWVDSLHLASEVPGFYTRYMATVKEDLGLAVTFSVSKDLYSQYQPVIDKMMSTLRVFRQKKQDLADLRGSGTDANFNDATFAPSGAMGDMQVNKTKKRVDGDSSGDQLGLLLLVVGAIVVFIVLKKRGGKGAAKKKKKQ